ncbi:unnamed protein product [Ceutorhynchus assimilis]|uniref:Dynein regulatory complex subunit 2 n=1 Tax=Ceutorhynchus assimilis TaxID=467358 RepID=A0A9N9MPH4_9CUCU|nr:unnamed protein product [Ceutorhynchus assimilis]
MPPKLTPEEKKARQANKRAEKKARQIEKRKQLKRDQLERELKYGAVTLRRQEQNWRKMLIDIAMPDMLKDLEFAWYNFERVADCKDFAISLLLDELDMAKQQGSLNLVTHMEHINKLIQMFDDRMHELNDDYKKQADEMQNEHMNNAKHLDVERKEETNYLKTMLYLLQMEMREVKRTRHAEYYSKLEEQYSKHQTLVHRIRHDLEEKHLQLWAKTVKFVEDYQVQIKDRKQINSKLKTVDDKLQKLIINQLEHIRACNDIIRGLEIKKRELEKFLERKVADLQSEFDFFFMVFDTLKKKLATDREIDFQKINCLTFNYNETISYLDEVFIKGKHVFQAASVCRKLETLSEKIMPFPVNFVNEMCRPSLTDIEDYMPSMDLFWQRVGQAEAERAAVNEQREYLISENDILKTRIHFYCQCLKCEDKQPIKTRPALCSTVTEGTQELKKYSKQGIIYSQFEDDEQSESLISFNDEGSPFNLNKNK